MSHFIDIRIGLVIETRKKFWWISIFPSHGNVLETLHESFYWHLSYHGNRNMTKELINNLWEFIFIEATGSCKYNILVYLRVDFDNFDLKKVWIVPILVRWSPRTTLRVNKTTIFKMFRCNFLKTKVPFEGTQEEFIGRVTWTIINWYLWIYNGVVRKIT